jgi:hypothetical protein
LQSRCNCPAWKHVRIAIHADDGGEEAARRWAGQRYPAGDASAYGVNFAGLVRPDGTPVKDLADYALLLNPEKPHPPLLLADLPGELTSTITATPGTTEGVPPTATA